MKICLPKQHGAWAMLIIPFWLGVVASEFMWSHIAFFIGWLFLYLATYPLLLLFKKKKMKYYTKWTIIYFVPAILLLLIPLFVQPSIIIFGLIMIPLFILNAYFSSNNRERAFTNDISAICVFAIAGLASSYLPNAEINSLAIIVFITSILFFTGCTFFVKTMIREKKNPTFKWLSWGFHIAVPFIWILLGEWLIAIAFIPSLIRAFVFYGKGMTMKKLGILEIINSAFFFIIMVIVVI
ncbi:YwiC-like family protein [Cytobacillus massiliigabonensis]|uniref:YwiC-like family protein n=1 Tax=Cytobacillus massiliigabonensis TaxID=1871011 RepID=UPI000C83E705|nr:YwiC-like family protein [Cytobacillus massiliigabonensis]